MAADKTPTAPRRASVATEAPRQKSAARRQAGATVPAAEADEVATAPATPDTAPSAPKGPSGKLGIVVALMRRPEGANVAQMSEATGWQGHSVRGALAGALKRKHKLTIVGEAGESGRIYRIAAEQPA